MSNTNTPSIGKLLYEELQKEVVFEKELWAIDHTDRVLSRIQAARKFPTKFFVTIPWLDAFTAFTAPGEYIFISRRLFQICRSDEMVAFTIAHEIAHHDLGHIDIFPNWFKNGVSADMKFLLMALYRTVETRIYGPEMECDADKYALDLCVKSGYNPSECLKLFNILEAYALDVGDLDAVFGPDESDDELAEEASWATKIRIWLYQRKRGYLPIRDRKQMLIKHLSNSTDTNQAK